MTFENNNQKKSLNLSNNNKMEEENKERNYFKKIIIGILILLFFLALYFIYLNFSNSNWFNNSNSSEMTIVDEFSYGNSDSVLLRENSDSISEYENETNNMSRTNIDEEFISSLKGKHVYLLTSSEPTGFYAMMGSFSSYKNAIKLQDMNMTDFPCHVFEPNENNMNRVGLYISESNFSVAENILSEIRNMNENSWLVFNTTN